MRQSIFFRTNFTLTVLTLFLLWSIPVYAKDSITWSYPDYDPYIILSGSYKGMGISDQIIQLLQKNLKGYDHKQLITENVLRTTEELKSGRNICTVTYLKTAERQKFACYSSVPSTISPAPGLIVKRKNLRKLGTGKKFSLEKLLENENLRAGVTEGRSYTKGIDALLKRFKGRKNIDYRAAGDVYKGLLLMLMADRFDYIIGTPLETFYMAKEYGISDKIVFVPLKEGGDYFMGYAACSDTPLGRKVIREIERILIRERPTAKYRSFFERWMPKEMVGEYRRAYRDIFLKAGQ